MKDEEMHHTTSSGPLAVAGPLVVCETNPRYFTIASGSALDRKVVYLTGSHIWNTFHDGLGPGTDCTDTDHYAPGRGDVLWAWKSFLRGHHPILMDFGLIGGINPPDAAFEPARYAMGDTLRFAERMNLIAMEPRDGITSTRYALANPGEEYLILQPSDKGGPFTVMLEPGNYSAEWFSIAGRTTVHREQTTVHSAAGTSFSAPPQASGPVVLHLKKAGH